MNIIHVGKLEAWFPCRAELSTESWVVPSGALIYGIKRFQPVSPCGKYSGYDNAS